MKLAFLLGIALALAALPVMAENPPNPCGNHGNNCNPGNGGDGGDASSKSFSWASVKSSNTNVNANTNVSSATGGAATSNATGGNGYGGTGFGGQASANADNRSSASGNTTTVTGDTYEAKRNAPSIAGSIVFPSASCKGGFGIGGSGVNGGGLLNVATTDKECQTILLGDHFATIGHRDVACELFKTTKAWDRALKKNPNLTADCSK